MAKVMRPVYQCDMKGCQFISLNEDDMTNVQFVTYDEENGQFCMKHMLLCNQHLEDFQKLNGDKNISFEEYPLEYAYRFINLLKREKLSDFNCKLL